MAAPHWWRQIRQHFGIRASRMAVHSRLPWWGRAAIGVAAVVAAAVIAWWIDAAGLFGAVNRRDLEAKVATLQSEVDRLQADATRLRERASQLDSEAAMSKGAQDMLTRQVNGLTGENTQLKEELAFLQRLFADSSKEVGLSIQRMTLDRASDESWHYGLIVVRGGPQTSDFEGRVGLVATIVPSDGRPQNLRLPEDQPDAAQALALKFKYYQRLEGTFRVPAGAQVTALTARVYDQAAAEPRATRTLTLP